jgi:hypothetical protein
VLLRFGQRLEASQTPLNRNRDNGNHPPRDASATGLHRARWDTCRAGIAFYNGVHAAANFQSNI